MESLYFYCNKIWLIHRRIRGKKLSGIFLRGVVKPLAGLPLQQRRNIPSFISTPDAVKTWLMQTGLLISNQSFLIFSRTQNKTNQAIPYTPPLKLRGFFYHINKLLAQLLKKLQIFTVVSGFM